LKLVVEYVKDGRWLRALKVVKDRKKEQTEDDIKRTNKNCEGKIHRILKCGGIE